MMKSEPFIVPDRHIYVLGLVFIAFLLLIGRAGYLQVIHKDELQKEGNARYLRNETIKPNRGLIRDRNGMILAASTPSDSIWVEPHVLIDHPQSWETLASTVGVNYDQMAEKVRQYSRQNRRFMYLRRHITPALSEKVRELNIPGLNLMKEYRRYYPYGEMLSNLVGYTNIDDAGIEGMERAMDHRLKGQSGLRQVIKDKNGRTIETVEHVRRVVDGDDVVLTIDSRIQHVVYKNLLKTVDDHKASKAISVVIDVVTGEILALASVPSFNPNAPSKRQLPAIMLPTDVFEPGSTAKPFVVAKALLDGVVRPDTIIDTSPGEIRVDGYKISDIRNYGELTVRDIIMKSSNIGVVDIGWQIDPEQLVDFYQEFGFGSRTGSMIGENDGLFPRRPKWRNSERATLTFGYGFSVTALQLVQAYAAIANNGTLVPLTIKVDERSNQTRRKVLPTNIAEEVVLMLERVCSPQGTSRRAKTPFYRVGGKSATVQKLIDGAYSSEQHLAMFVGFAPVSEPRLAAVVIVDDPKGKVHYGGYVAAPAFREIMSAALKILDIPPDDVAQFAETQPSGAGSQEEIL